VRAARAVGLVVVGLLDQIDDLRVVDYEGFPERYGTFRIISVRTFPAPSGLDDDGQAHRFDVFRSIESRPDQETDMDEARARALVAAERRRIEAALGELAGDQVNEDASHLDQTGESSEAGADVQHEMVDDALAARLRNDLAAVSRAETRIAEGTFGLSIESGAPIPDDRLEAQPLAERTVEEQSRYERDQR
jgi:DnaK suppressor protein